MIGLMTRGVPIDDGSHQQTVVSSPATDTSFTHRPWLLALVLVIITFVAYQPVWHAGFIWDDDDHLTANPAMTAPHGLEMIWSSLAVSRYYPLTLTTFWIQRRFWDLNPLPYHLVNVLVHTINGLLLFLVLRRLKIPGAWVAAMLWTLHPVNVESVAWITELKNTQSALFFFLSVLCFLRSEASRKQGWYALAVACGLAAMLSKPSTVVLPLALLLCVWWERGRWNRRDVVRTAPFFGLAAGMSALTIIEQRRRVLRVGAAEWQLGVGQRLVVAGKAIWFYAAKVLWPSRLTFVYPRWTVDAWSWRPWVPTAALVAVGVALWRCRNRAWCQAVLFGGGFFVVALLPVLGFFDVFYFRYSFVADHFQYLASVGIITLVFGGGAALCDHAGSTGRRVGAAAAAFLMTALGTLTWRQGHIYQDAETLWRDTIAKDPRCWMAHNNLGLTLVSLGRTQEGIGQYEDALRIKPDHAETHYNLGIALAQAGRMEDAIGQYEQALRIKPEYAEAQSNLGATLGQVGRMPEAIEHLEQALRIEPDSAEVHLNLGLALVQVGRVPEAIDHWQQALRINPKYAEPHYYLGVASEQAGRMQEAIAHYEQALRINPDFAEARAALAQLQGRQ